MIVVGNPGNRRTDGLQRARRALGLPPAYVLTYEDLLSGHNSLAQAAAEAVEIAPLPPFAPLVIRIDAPGEYFPVERQLIAWGAPDAPDDHAAPDSPATPSVPGVPGGRDRLLPYGGAPDPWPLGWRQAQALEERPGGLYHPSQWFRGYARLLAKLEREAGQLPHPVEWINSPANIVQMFDKRETHRLLWQGNVPVPRLLAPPGAIGDYSELLAEMRRQRMYRVFIKLASGSGACGVIAYQYNPRTGAQIAATSLGMERLSSGLPLFYNAMRLRRYERADAIAPLVDWLLRHGAHLEMWVAKAAYGGKALDIRQLVVCGEACHSIARASSTPITNLHLRNQRMSMDEAGLPHDAQQRVRASAEQALAVFPHSRIAGVDVLLASGTLQPYVIDVNPFGDLLYRVEQQGQDTYTWELARLMRSADIWT